MARKQNENSINNLTSFNQMPPEKARAIQKMGGKASAQKAKERKALKNIGEIAAAFLDADTISPQAKEEYRKKYGLTDEMMSNRLPIVMRLFSTIVSKDEKTADALQAAKLLIELAGESPAQLAVKEAEQKSKLQIEDDPFTKSILEMFGQGGAK